MEIQLNIHFVLRLSLNLLAAVLATTLFFFGLGQILPPHKVLVRIHKSFLKPVKHDLIHAFKEYGFL